MCPASPFSRFMIAAAAVGLVALTIQPALAAEGLRLGRPSIFSPVSAFPGGVLTIGYLTPAYGTASTLSGSLLSTSTGAAQPFDVAGSYSTAPVSLGRVGVFGGYDQRPSVLALAPTASWNFGASLGYAGFYVRGGVNETTATGPLLGLQGMEAGFGYEIGAFDLRMTYLTSQAIGNAAHEMDNQQWSIGGIYQISPRLRVNADAFYGVGDARGTSLGVLPPLTAPPGTGARVGVELRF